jgi:ATP-binding cassette subfamily B protein
VSTIANADQILVIEDGRQIGLGTHRELLASCPTYGEIVASQLTAEEAA